MDRDSLTERLRDAFPSFESILIAVLCLGALLIFLDILGIDVIENLAGGGVGDMGYLLYPAAMVLLSYLVERFRDAFDGPHTTDVPDPLVDREREGEGKDDENADESAIEERTVEFARSQNKPAE